MFDWVVFASLVVAIAAYRQTKDLARRLDALREELDDLHARGQTESQGRRGSAVELTPAEAHASPEKRDVAVDLAAKTDAPAQPAAVLSALPPPPRIPPPPVVPPPSIPTAPEIDRERVPPVVVPARPPQPSTPPVPPPPPPTALEIDWERWIGVRGAALFGGVVLAMAGVFLFRYSIEHGLIPPWLRVALGFAAGSACLASSEWVLRKRYPVTANPVAGAGTVIFYATAWAAHGLYGLIGSQTCFLLMMLVTATCCALSWRYDTLVIAIIGLIGGFLTPLLLASGSDNPLGLFGYVLLLDGGLLYLARQRRWPSLAILSLVGTVFYEASWLLLQLDAERLWLGILIVGVFAAVFALAVPAAEDTDSGQEWWNTRAAGVLLPFAFVFYFASQSSLSPHLYPLASLLVLLVAAATWIGKQQRQDWMGTAAASGLVAVFAVWLLGHSLTTALAWEMMLVTLLSAGVTHAFVEWPGSDIRLVTKQALIVLLGLFALSIFAASDADDVAVWPWVVGWTLLAALLTRHAERAGPGELRLVASVLLAVALALLDMAQANSPQFPDKPVYMAILIGVAILAQLSALRLSGAEAVAGNSAAAALPTILLLYLPVSLFVTGRVPQPLVLLLATILLAALAALAAARVPSGRWLLAAVVATCCAQSGWTAWAVVTEVPGPAVAFFVQLATVAALSAFPFVFRAALVREAWAWNAAALVGPLWFLSLRELFEASWGDSFIGVLPVGLAGIALAAAQQARSVWPDDAAARQGRAVWFLAMALSFMALAIPLQMEKEWITLGWALEGLAILMLWRRSDHPGLKYFALLLLAAATTRLFTHSTLLAYYPRPHWRIVNWLLYTYLVPATALLWSAKILAPAELPRLQSWEQRFYGAGYPIGATLSGLAGVAVIFVWINLAIADWFSDGTTIQVSFSRLPARDLATSIAWIVYALILLAAGVRLVQRELRWLSLGLLMVTIAKVFLYDLGELGDLYRVASLLGLALSLLVVSLAYQRFVAKPAKAEDP